MKAQVEMIQPGWAVYSSDGEELGKVTTLDDHNLIIKGSGFLRDTEILAPRSAVADVETGRVELSMSRHSVQKFQP